MSEVPVHQWVHSTYVHNRKIDSDAVIVKSKYVDENGKVQPYLNVIKDPRRSFWITKPAFRNHEFKKEYCDLTELDEFPVANKDVPREIFKQLNGYYPKRNVTLMEVCDSPYVYGADIPIDTLVKRHYAHKYGDRTPLPITTGFLDIETCVLSGRIGEINLITVTHDTSHEDENGVLVHSAEVYCAILDSFLYKTVESKEYGKLKHKATLDDVKEVVLNALSQYIDQYNLNIHFFVGEKEIELIEWIFKRIHENKTDFIGIWNMNFDIPKIIDAIRRSCGPDASFAEVNARIEEIMCHPDVPKEYRKAYYKEDKRNVAHFTDKWHWFYLSGYTQILDSIGLYSRIRKVKGYKASYTLNAILADEVGLSKLPLGEENSHYIMQTERFLDYIAYNIFDSVSLQIMEWANTDITTMTYLAGTTTFDKYSAQTRMVTNDLYDYCIEHGKVTATTGRDMTTDYTKLIQNTGGTVLNPERSIGVGMNCLVERPDFETMLHIFVSDVDFSAYYPNTQCAANISKETKLSTGVQIEGLNLEATQSFFSEIISPRENAVHICSTYFGLPTYKEMEDLIGVL